MRFDLSLRGPRRSFVVESFKTLEGRLLPRTLACFGDGCTVQIVDEVSPPPSETLDGHPPSLRVSNIAGIEQSLAKLNDFFEDFEFNQAEPSWSKRSRGVILHGSRGTGKSLILKKISETGWGIVFHVKANTAASGLREIFKDATQSPCSIILIDELDLLVPNIGRTLCEEMDRLSAAESSGGGTSPNIVVIAAASKLSDIPSSLRKRGRLNTEILIPVPAADARRRILKSLAPPDSPESLLQLLNELGDRTHAYTGEDLALLLDKACEIARRRLREAQANSLPTKPTLLKEDLDDALLAVRPSAMHDITLQPPKVRWGEIGGQHEIKKALRRAVETPLKYPDLILRLGATPKKGLLLYGPPGCSKTLSAQAMATEIGFNFFAVKGAELLNMYVGESERAVREVFARARAASPSIIFFDEVESIGGKREGGAGGAGGRTSGGTNVLTTLLNEMDGIEALKGVTVLAATNKPEALDLALLRPGRFDDLLYVAPPDRAGREDILHVRQKRMDWDVDVDVGRLAELTEGYSGAEIVGICQAACDKVIDRALDTGDMGLKVKMEDFVGAMELVKRQITPELIEGYRRWAAGVRNH
jgi:AAA family ATPase